jgi:hypothetical protein
MPNVECRTAEYRKANALTRVTLSVFGIWHSALEYPPMFDVLSLALSGLAMVGPAQQPSQPPPPPPPAVKVGEPAPDFTLTYLAPAGEGGKVERKQVTLGDYKGKQNVVLAWFPAAFSPG